LSPGIFAVPADRWLAEARLHYHEAPDGLRITYDPALRDAFLAALSGPAAEAWPLFDACAGLPLALIRGENSDLLSQETAPEMRRRRWAGREIELRRARFGLRLDAGQVVAEGSAVMLALVELEAGAGEGSEGFGGFGKKSWVFPKAVWI
jgi:hypothetical protein